MKDNPEFSVIVTAYNKAKYIGTTIQSVLAQSHRDFEVVILDDGSSDGTKEIIFTFKDERIRYFYQENSGLPACARNKAMSLSKGKYLAILDGDDCWHKDKLARCKKALDENPTIGLVCHNQAILYDDRIVGFSSCRPYPERLYEKLLFKGDIIPTSSVVFRRKIFSEDNFRFSEESRHIAVEDHEYWLRVSQKYRFYLIPDILGCYRVTDNGDQLKNPEVNARNMLALLDYHFSKLGHIDKDMHRRIKIRRSSVICGSARIYLHKRNFRASRQWYARAMAEYPLNYKAVIGFFASILRKRVLYK